MRAPMNDLPIVFDAATLRQGGVTIIDSISLTIAAGVPTVLIGPNGAGKTFLLRLAMGLVRPTEGRITWGGLEELTPQRRAIVFQRPVMLRRSTLANVIYALAAAGHAKRTRGTRAEQLLELVGLSRLAARPARKLSGGETQRLAIARALAKDPTVLFLDEPTASLDPAATNTIENLIHTIAAAGIKIVMATHDLGEARRLAGEVVLLHRGRVIERGDAETFFSAPQTTEAKKFIAGELLV
jgi:tungstate transport system ATP-binding protein